jgi:hypothetical protein
MRYAAFIYLDSDGEAQLSMLCQYHQDLMLMGLPVRDGRKCLLAPPVYVAILSSFAHFGV